ncbi:MAG: hypothetical protein M1818_005638 [Claussenomyces sp. TS43310]|nr:MAG: hypothetical protein M1818_005638 [Claussenomyces sp. TS43310]
MPSRPPMHARDASGRQVSLLNDDAADSSSPRTPDLLRADSYDSQMSALSPLTPTSFEFGGRRASYATVYPDPTRCDQRPYGSAPYSEGRRSVENMQRPSYSSPKSSCYDDDDDDDDDDDAMSESAPDRQTMGKRYPCRYKDSHSCDKTFTTSGHASRHSKIHTAEKAVNCSFPGCQKKFTRADNMKQHLETHYKDRSRASQKALTGTKVKIPAGVRKSPSATADRLHHSSISRAAAPRDPRPPYDFYAPLSTPVSPIGNLDMKAFQQALPTQPAARSPMHVRTTSATYRLEALASIASNTRR